jgi:hypothetical protein
MKHFKENVFVQLPPSLIITAFIEVLSKSVDLIMGWYCSRTHFFLPGYE